MHYAKFGQNTIVGGFIPREACLFLEEDFQTTGVNSAVLFSPASLNKSFKAYLAKAHTFMALMPQKANKMVK